MKTKNAGLSLAALASIMLFSQVAEAAECSEDVQTILSLSATASSLVRKVGPVATVGFALQNTFICDQQEPLDTDAVIALIRDELDDVAFTQVRLGLIFAQDKMEFLANDLAGDDPAFDDVDFETMDDTTASHLQDKIESARDAIRGVELDFLPTLTTRNNGRLSYDMSAAIMLANHKLTLVQLSTAASRANRYRDFALAVANEILADVEAYEEESDRLRGMSIDIERTPTSSTGWIVRSGQRAAFGADQSYFIGLSNSTRDQIDNAVRSEIESTIFEPFLAELDVQDAHFAMLKARAEAILADPFGALAEVSTTPQTPVMLKSASSAANDRCLFNRRGFLGVDDELRNGATRMRSCSPSRSHQQWFLEEDGHVRSSIANLCLTASPSKAVMIDECDPDDPRQIWTHVGNQFRVDVDGVRTCLAPSKSGVNATDAVARHIACDVEHEEQQWLAYAPLKLGRALSISGAESGPLSFEQIQNLSQEFDAAIDEGFCVQGPSGFGAVSMKSCDRFNLKQLWAHDDQGRIRPTDLGLRAMSFTADGRIQTEGVGATGVKPELLFDRTAAADGTVVYTRRDNGEFLLGEPEFFGPLRTSEAIIDDDGDLDASLIWQHSTTGKLAE